MKTLLLFSCLLIYSVLVYSQPSNPYFPPGSVYTYKVFPLDSLSNPITSEMFYRRDLFADVADYEGKQANIFVTKNAQTADSLEIKPYLDSIFYHFHGTEGYQYFQLGQLENFLRSLDSMGLDPNFNFLNFFTSFQNWYSLYRFSATTNDEYTLLSIDTTIAGFNARFEYLGERFPDEMILTEPYGHIDCKKFLIRWRVSVFFINWLPLITTNDTIWFAPGNEFWMTKEFVPTNHIDLTFFGLGVVTIPGFTTGDVVVPVEEEIESLIPTEIVLEQNYPNPFNPSTNIKFSLPASGLATLKIYNALGEEVAELLNKDLTAGTHEVEWNAIGFTSGVFFYQLQTDGYIETKKMILLR